MSFRQHKFMTPEHREFMFLDIRQRRLSTLFWKAWFHTVFSLQIVFFLYFRFFFSKVLFFNFLQENQFSSIFSESSNFHIFPSENIYFLIETLFLYVFKFFHTNQKCTNFHLEIPRKNFSSLGLWARQMNYYYVSVILLRINSCLSTHTQYNICNIRKLKHKHRV